MVSACSFAGSGGPDDHGTRRPVAQDPGIPTLIAGRETRRCTAEKYRNRRGNRQTSMDQALFDEWMTNIVTRPTFIWTHIEDDRDRE
jgi:hypothetical protein